MTDGVWVLRAPQLNPNDETLTLTRLLVADGCAVSPGEAVVEVETAKAAVELPVEAGGIVVFAVEAGASVKVGASLAYVGDRAAIDALIAREASDRRTTIPTAGPRSATPKAARLAQAHGVDLSALTPSAGTTLKEADVRRYLESRGITAESAVPDRTTAAAVVPAHIRARMADAGALSAHQRQVATNLRSALRAGIFTTLDFTLDLDGPRRRIADELRLGRQVSLLPLLIAALAETLPHFPLLLSIIDADRILRHHAADIAFVTRSLDGRLFTPVVRNAASRDFIDLIKDCTRLSKQAMKGKVDATDMDGAAMTVSLIPTKGVSSFVALPAPYQAAIVAIGAERTELYLAADGSLASRAVATATITYDHGVCDGIYAADFMAAVNKALNRETS